MMKSYIIEKIKNNPKFKRWILNLMMHPVKTRPRFWLRCFQFLYMKRGKRSVIYGSVRKDIVPFRLFSLGRHSVIEDYSIINNAVGDIVIGDNCRVGISSLVLGPVIIEQNVNIGQHVILSGLNHDYQDISVSPNQQQIFSKQIVIHDNVWIGANSVILPGVSIGPNSMIGAGSIVTKDIPAYSVAVGNPARVVKQYDVESGQWIIK